MTWRRVSIGLMSLLCLVGGASHFLIAEFYYFNMPLWLPAHHFLLKSSGVIEIILGALLLPVATRRAAAWLVIAMLLIYLALIHIPMAIEYYHYNDPLAWLAYIRIPIQFFFIWWAYRLCLSIKANGNSRP